jgi:Protein of unknown function (DUF3631)
MSTALPPIAKLAELLNGDVVGGEVLCPGPGHSVDDRSLCVKLDQKDREGFLTHSFANDDFRTCRDHVRKLLGLPEPKPKKPNGGKAWITRGEYIYRDADGEPFLKIRKCLDEKGKKQYPQSHWTGTDWAKGKPDAPKIPYRLPQLIAAPQTAVIYFCEGERDADTLVKIGFVATTASEGAAAKWDTALTQYFTGRTIVILPDADQPGRAHAEKVAKAIHSVAASVRVVDLYPDRHDGSDVSDWLANDTAGVKLAKLVKEADEWEPSGGTGETGSGAEPDDEITIEIARLAALSMIKYEQERIAAAEALGIRASTLDRLVQAESDRKRRASGDDDDGKLQGRALKFDDPTPWDESVDGAELLDAITKTIRDYVILEEWQARAIAVWVLHTYLVDAFQFSPRLCITSPTKGCGKTTLLDVVSGAVLRALSAANVSTSSVFRVIEMCRPTLTIDEADSFVDTNNELRGVLNSGHRKGGAVLRVVGDELEPRQFSTYSACAIALIGALPSTLADRSITIELKRKRAGEKAKPFRLDRVEPLKTLARQAARWAQDHAIEIGATEAELPPEIYNRAADNWRVLKQIAVVAGGEWPDHIDNAALTATTAASDEELLIQLLMDIRDIEFAYDVHGHDNQGKEIIRETFEGEISSAVLVQRLTELQDAHGPSCRTTTARPLPRTSWLAC